MQLNCKFLEQGWTRLFLFFLSPFSRVSKIASSQKWRLSRIGSIVERVTTRVRSSMQRRGNRNGYERIHLKTHVWSHITSLLLHNLASILLDLSTHSNFVDFVFRLLSNRKLTRSLGIYIQERYEASFQDDETIKNTRI